MVRKTKVLLAFCTPVYRCSGIVTLLAFFTVIFPGCLTKPETSDIRKESASVPGMMAKNIEVIFSDSGKIQAKLYSLLLNRYAGSDPYTEFPKGFRVCIYDSAMRVETTISGNYGKRMDYQRIMEARGNVVVRNELKNQQLNTEYLIWDENRRKISSKTKVKITTGSMVLFGDGLESNETFSEYTIVNPHGQMTVSNDSL